MTLPLNFISIFLTCTCMYADVCLCMFSILRHLAAYIFGGVLARELDEFKSRWNNHRIRWNRLASCPCDVPTDLYHLVGNMGMLQRTELAYMLFTGYFIYRW